MHLVFLVLKDNIHEIPELPSLTREIGIDEVILTNVCHCINIWQEQQRVFVWESDRNPYEEIVKQAETKARESLKIRLKKPSLSAIDVPVCEENPLRNHLSRWRSFAVRLSILLYLPLLKGFSAVRNTRRRK